MTKDEWMKSQEPEAMLQHLGSKGPLGLQFPNGRKLKKWVEACREVGTTSDFSNLNDDAGLRVAVGYWTSLDGGVPGEVRAALLRDVFGDSGKPVELKPAWRTPTVCHVARDILVNRRWPELPVLGDALEESGCDEKEVLGHLRGDGPHCAVCWALALVLGAEATGEPTDVGFLLGKTLWSVEEKDGGVVFTVNDSRKYALVHNQECCETVRLEDVVGDLNDLVGAPILMAEESEGKGDRPADADKTGGNDSWRWTFYRLATVKGYVTLRFYGESNGYYSEKANFEPVRA